MFRVHFADGHKIDVEATDPTKARHAASKQHPGVGVTKVKRVRF